MAEEVALDLKINTGGSSQTVKQLKDEIKSVNNEMLKVKEGSAAYQDLAKKAEAAANTISNLKKATNLFASGGTLSEIANVGQTIAGGFAAAQGAMALFGSESENVQKQLLKVQAGIAIVEGIKSAIAGWESVQRLLNLAMAANPIGVIIAGVVALTAAIGYLISSYDGLAEAQKEVNEEYEKQKKLSAESAAEVKKEHDARTRARQFEIDLNKAKGASDEELYKLEKSLLEKKRMDLENEILNSKSATEEQYKQRAQLARDLLLLDANYNRTRAEKEKEAADKRKDEDEKRNKEELDRKKKQHKDLLNAEIDDAKAGEAFATGFQTEEDTKKADQAKLDADWNKMLLAQQKKDNLAFAEEDKRANEEKIAQDKAVMDAKLSIASATASSLSSLGTLFINDSKKLAEFQKKAAVLQIAVDTAKAISSTIANAAQASEAGGPAAPYLMVAYIATGIATVLANIAKAKQLLSSAGASGMSSPSSGGSGSAGAPPTPVVQNVGVATFGTNNQGDLNGTKTASVVKAYVVESEMTATQKNIASIVKKSKVE